MAGDYRLVHALRQIGGLLTSEFAFTNARSNSIDLAEPMIEKNIFLLWHAPVTAAPKIVSYCIDRCRTLNPGWDVHVLDGRGADSLLRADFSEEVLSTINITQKSDLLRVKLLRDNGGVWMDATCLLHDPLDTWIDAYLSGDMTAIKSHHPARLLNIWFMAARKRSAVLTGFYETLISYWATPKMRLSTDAEWTAIIDENFRLYVDDHAAHTLRVYPYFLFNYLFIKKAEEDRNFSDAFSECELVEPQERSGFSTVLRAFRAGASSRDEAFRADRYNAAVRMIRGLKTPMSKLTWKSSSLEYPFEAMDRALSERASSR